MEIRIIKVSKTLTATHDLADGRLLSIFPNPTNNILTIESKNTPLSNLTLFNAFGQVLKTVKGENRWQITLDVRDLPNGVYFLKVDNYSLRKILVYP